MVVLLITGMFIKADRPVNNNYLKRSNDADFAKYPMIEVFS